MSEVAEVCKIHQKGLLSNIVLQVCFSPPILLPPVELAREQDMLSDRLVWSALAAIATAEAGAAGVASHNRDGTGSWQ